MNVKKYLTLLAGAALLCACTDDVAVKPDTGDGGGGGSTASGSITFRVDGLVGGSTEQTTKAGTVIANAAENEIKVLDILVFAYAESNSVTDATSPTPANIGDPTRWSLQEWHYYSSEEITDENDPFFRPIPSTEAGKENNFHRFALQGSGAYRVATLSPTVGLTTGDLRYLRFVMVANGAIDKTWMAKENFLNAAGDNAKSTKDLRDWQNSGLPLFARGTAIECPLPMVAKFAQTGGVDYITPDGTTAAYTLNATLSRLVTRFDIVNLTPGNFTLTKIETLKPLNGTVSMETLRPKVGNTAPFYAADMASINIPTLNQVDADGNLLWKTTSTDAMVLNSAFYTTPSAQNNYTATTSNQKMSLKVYGKNGNQEIEKEIDLIIDPTGTPSYNIAPNTRYRLNVTYYDGLQATMEVVEWTDDYLNPDLVTAQKPVVKVPANRFTSDTPDATTGMHPYAGWYWEDLSTNPDWKGDIPYIAAIPLTDLEAAQTLSFDMVTEYEAAEFPFEFQIVNALHPNQPDNVWLRTTNPIEYGGVTRDATDPKLWHVKLIAQEGKVSNLSTLDPLKIRIYSKENPENYVFMDIVQPSECPALYVYWTANKVTTPQWGNGAITITDLRQPLIFTFAEKMLGKMTIKAYYKGVDYGMTLTDEGSPCSLQHATNNIMNFNFLKVDHFSITFDNYPDNTFEYDLIVK